MDVKSIALSRFYFDHANYTPSFQSVRNILVEKLEIPFIENPPSFAFDEALEKEIVSAYDIIKSFFLFGENDHLLCTASYQYAIDEVFDYHLEKIVKTTGRNQIFALDIERKEIQNCLQKMKKSNCLIEKIPVNQKGQIDFEKFKLQITPKTSLITISWADTSTGVIQPIEELYQFCLDNKIYLHVDVTHVMGKIYFRMQDVPIDYLTADPYQMGGIYGFGLAVFKDRKINLYSQNELFLGPKNYAKFIAFAMHAYEIMQMTDEFFFDMPKIKEAVEKKVLQNIAGSQVVFSNRERLQSHLVLYLPNVSQEMMQFYLAEKEFYISINSCSNFSLKEHLEKIGVKEDIASSTIILSLSPKNQIEYAEKIAEKICEVYQFVRKFCQSEII